VHLPESRWKFSLAVLLPVAAAILVTLGLAAAFVIWSADRTDERALARQQSLATRIVATARSTIEGEQGTAVLRPEATEAFLGDKPDMDAIETQFGIAEYDDYSHDRVYVLDPDLKPVFAASEGKTRPVAAYDVDRTVIDPLAVRFRSSENVAAIAAFEDGDADWPPQLSDWVVLDGRVALATVMPIVSDWTDQEQTPGNYYLHALVRYLDDDLASGLIDQYMLDGIAFAATPASAPDQLALPIADASGRFIAWFKWTPERPGRELLTETLPASLGLLAVVGLIIALLLFSLARSTRALERARADALHRATHDPLTGLANRALFTERLERAPLPLTLLALDLDRFKAVNDTFGHEAGDELLRQVAARLSPLIGENDVLARLGGDEFMMLLSGDADSRRIADLASGIVRTLGEPFRLATGTANIGVSVGIATALTDERSDLVSRADFALYDAKESGRNTLRVFDDLQKAA
jgi:diguanylate cyclase (GGDEF)-like protein